ncbi:MAG: hypothetical protein HKP40_05355 [Litoreibacter sp.]|nr:hypothetical protein [Litoreibacter sp.]
MSTDFILFVGIVLAVLSLPPLLGSVMRGNPPRVASIVAVLAGVMIVYAISSRPGGYEFGDLPRVFQSPFSAFNF